MKELKDGAATWQNVCVARAKKYKSVPEERPAPLRGRVQDIAKEIEARPFIRGKTVSAVSCNLHVTEDYDADVTYIRQRDTMTDAYR